MQTTITSIRTLEAKAERMLEKYPEARNSDIVLQALICANFYPPLERPINNWEDFVHTMQRVPSMDHVARVRRKIIEKHGYKKYLPTRKEVALARKINEETWKTYASAEKLPIYNPNTATGNVPAGYDDEGKRNHE